jgi:CDP-diacylglycerol---serine O-phosphatidyltransferase
VALLMVSNVPTVSLKRIRVAPHLVVPTLLGVGVATAFFTTAPWPTLTCVGAVYLASIPLTIRASLRLRRSAAGPRPAETAESAVVLPPAASLPAGDAPPPATEWRH